MDMANYRDVFIEEANEITDNLNKALLAFEKDTENLTPVNELFRSAHTMKGMAATMGYDRLTEFTHSLEDLLDSVRSGKIPATREVLDIFYKSVDVMTEFITSIESTNTDTSTDAKEVIARIQGLGKTQAKPAAAVTVQAAAAAPAAQAQETPALGVETEIMSQAAAQGLSVLRIKVWISQACVFKNVRAFMVSRNLLEKGEIIKSNPPAKVIEEGNFGGEIEFIYITKSTPEDARAAAAKVAEIEKVLVEKLEAAPASHPEVPEGEAVVKQKAVSDDSKKAGLSQSVRVNITKLDSLMNLVGELVITKIRLDEISKDKKYAMLLDAVEEFDRIISELQIEVTEVRMLPVAHIFDKFPRIVRDLASDEGKEIDTEIVGGDIEIDRTVLEEINEPLLHLVRNSAAHGIEMPQDRTRVGKSKKGTIRLSARRDRNSVIIEVTDDGKGVNVEAVKRKALEKKIVDEEKLSHMSDDEVVNLISLPGFSTVEKAGKIAGRGVGVDVVKTKVEKSGGIFKIENHPGEGVKFILKLPLTLSIIQALMVKAAGAIYALPVIHTIETLEYKKEEIKNIQSKRVIVLRDEVIPVLSLAELLGKPRPETELVQIVIVDVRDKKVALEVDIVMGQQEVAIKSLGEFLKYARGFSGVTILGDGKISMILDIQSLLEETA